MEDKLHAPVRGTLALPVEHFLPGIVGPLWIEKQGLARLTGNSPRNG